MDSGVIEMYKFDPTNALFYPAASISDYKLSEDEIATFTDISEEAATEFLGFPPTGKIRGSDGYGNPAWVDAPPPSHEQQVIDAEHEKNRLISFAKEHIRLWQTQLQLGMISDADKAKLIEWMHYITALQAVDTSTAPDINWPQQPAE